MGWMSPSPDAGAPRGPARARQAARTAPRAARTAPSAARPASLAALAATLVASLAACQKGEGLRARDCGAPDGEVNVVLGRPTATSITASVLVEPGATVYVAYGDAPGAEAAQTAMVTAPAAAPAAPDAGAPPTVPVEVELTGLTADTRYHYRVHVRNAGATDFVAGAEHAFHTARAPGATFHFGVQGDSHPEREGKMYAPELYLRNMQNAVARQPDFYLALGDDFSIEELLEKDALTQAAVDEAYRCQRTPLGLVGRDAAVYLVNGNHEQAAGYLLTDAYPTAFRDAPIFAGRARTTFFPLPAPDGFYGGDPDQVEGVGPLRDYYAWTWGDALFVAIDPYWHSPVPVDTGVPGLGKTGDEWQITMGEAQHRWLEETLTASHARYKFVFEHHLLGRGRGAAALVHTYEWGGYGADGKTYELPARRPGWTRSIHQLFVDTKVTIFFGAHDHVFAREEVDGVVYQAVPNPADDTYTAFNADAYAPASIALPGASYDPGRAVVLPNAGFLDVAVAPEGVTVSYVRAVLPGDEAAAGAANGEVSHAYTVVAR